MWRAPEVSTFILTLSLAAIASAAPSTETAIYSNACESGGGDWQGFRVTITRQANKVAGVLVEFNDDGPDGKDMAKDIRFDAASGKMSFSFQGGGMARDESHTFKGYLSRTRLLGTFDNDIKVTLPIAKKVPKFLHACTNPQP